MKTGVPFRRELRRAVFALPVAAMLFAGARLAGESQTSEEEPRDDSDEATQADSLMLVNCTDTAFVALAFHPKSARPLKSKIKVDLDKGRAFEGSSFFVAAGDSTALWPCDSLDAYEDYTLHLYRLPNGGQGVVQASLAGSVELTTDRLNTARHQRCRLEVDEL